MARSSLSKRFSDVDQVPVQVNDDRSPIALFCLLAEHADALGDLINTSPWGKYLSLRLVSQPLKNSTSVRHPVVGHQDVHVGWKMDGR